MRFKDLINKYKFSDIRKRLLELYPDQKKCVKGYEAVFNRLRKIKPAKTDVRIIVYFVSKDEKLVEKEYVAVCGANENMKYATCAIEFTPWEQWLSMPIDIQSVWNFKEVDIICHCLWEMTYSGFTQQKIQGQMRMLNNRVKKVKSNPEKYTVPL